jgi:hypothetical protein
MANERKIYSRWVVADTAAVNPGQMDFGKPMGQLFIYNKGPNDCFVKFDGIATGVRADDQPKISAGVAINFQNVSIKTISVFALAGTGTTSEVDASGSVAVP